MLLRFLNKANTYLTWEEFEYELGNKGEILSSQESLAREAGELYTFGLSA